VKYPYSSYLKSIFYEDLNLRTRQNDVIYMPQIEALIVNSSFKSVPFKPKISNDFEDIHNKFLRLFERLVQFPILSRVSNVSFSVPLETRKGLFLTQLSELEKYKIKVSRGVFSDLDPSLFLDKVLVEILSRLNDKEFSVSFVRNYLISEQVCKMQWNLKKSEGQLKGHSRKKSLHLLSIEITDPSKLFKSREISQRLSSMEISIISTANCLEDVLLLLRYPHIAKSFFFYGVTSSLEEGSEQTLHQMKAAQEKQRDPLFSTKN